MIIDNNTVLKVAKLARIGIKTTEISSLSNELSSILEFVDQLNEADISDVKPMTSVTPIKSDLRDDEITDGDKSKLILKNAPNEREGFFAVPKVIE